MTPTSRVRILLVPVLLALAAGCSDSPAPVSAPGVVSVSPTVAVPPDPDGVRACEWAKRVSGAPLDVVPAEVIQVAGWARGSSDWNIRALAPELERTAREVLAAVSDSAAAMAKIRMGTPVTQLYTVCLTDRYVTP